nr:protein KINESIN LIGHT CHAIN-RELATED 1 [Ipomoea batatas]
MRRASSIVFPHLHRHAKASSFISKHINSHFSSLNSTTPSHPNLKPCSKTQSSLFSNGKPQMFNTLADQTPLQMSSRQRKIKERSELEEAFESAETTEEMLKALRDMEACFDETQLGMACLKMGLKLDQEGNDPEKALSFASRALNALDRDDKLSLPLAMTLQLMGSACYSLKRFNDSLGYLNRAKRVLGQLEKGGSCSVEDFGPVLHAVELELYNTKTAMGRREEALVNLRKSLELKEMSLEENSRELGKANRDVAEAYVAVLNFDEALPFCLKALEIHKGQLGNNSVEVAHDRRLLGIIYTGLEEHEKALEQNQLSQRVLKNWGRGSELLQAEVDAANMQIALGRYDEAIETLKGVVQRTDRESKDRAMVFVSMAKALCNQEKFPDSKRCLDVACGILGKKESSSPVEVSEAYMEISMQYETMDEFETAISLLKRALRMLDKIPQEQHSVGSVSARIGWLLLLTGKVDQGIPYLEDAAERLKESFGSKHYSIGYVYNNLGAAYMELDRPQSAAQVFAYAKDIMDVSLGPHHADSIEACQNLSRAYAAMGSYQLAINFQKKVIEAWEGHGPNAEDELKEAYRILEQLKMKACVSLPEQPPIKALPSSNASSLNSNCQSDVSITER